jgi:hypothetical protein
MTDERFTRLGAALTDADLWQMGQQASDPGDWDLDQSPQKGESFEEWQARVKSLALATMQIVDDS